MTELSFQDYFYMIKDNYSSIAERYKILEQKIKIPNDNNYRVYLYGILPEKLIPAAYIPFYRDKDNINKTFDILTLKDKFPNSYYNTVYDSVYNNEINKDILKTALEEIFNKLDSPDNYYNYSMTSRMIIICSFFWVLIILLFLRIIHYYYHNIYNYILITIIILLLLIAIISKIFYTLQ
jgi:hypothetical protein